MDGHLVLLSALDKCVPFCLPVMANTSTDTQNKLSLDRRGKRRMSTRNGKKETLKRPERKCISAHMQKSMQKSERIWRRWRRRWWWLCSWWWLYTTLLALKALQQQQQQSPAGQLGQWVQWYCAAIATVGHRQQTGQRKNATNDHFVEELIYVCKVQVSPVARQASLDATSRRHWNVRVVARVSNHLPQIIWPQSSHTNSLASEQEHWGPVCSGRKQRERETA